MLSRRDFIKGMGALALIPFIPEMVKPEPEYMTASDIIRKRAEMVKYMKIQWKNAGTMIIPNTEDGETTRYKVRYTVTEDGTEAEIVEEE